jgi:hypothetical protein
MSQIGQKRPVTLGFRLSGHRSSRQFLVFPAFRAMWKVSRAQYGAEYQQFVDSLLTALPAARDELLAVDHSLQPYMPPKQVKVEIDFQVQKRLDAKADVGFLLFVDISGENAFRLAPPTFLAQ